MPNDVNFDASEAGLSNAVENPTAARLGNLVEIAQAGETAASAPVNATVEQYRFPGIEIDGERQEILHASEEQQQITESETPEQRKQRFAKRFHEVTGQKSEHADGPEAELRAWADSWRDFVEVADIPEGNFRELLQEVGAQVILGEIEEQKLTQSLKGIDNTADTAAALEDFNKQLRSFGVEASLSFDDTGRSSGFELATVARQGARARFRFDRSGQVTATGTGADGEPLSKEEAIKQVAKKASPLACP